MNGNDLPRPHDEELVERLLAAEAGPPGLASAEQLERWQRLFAAELQATRRRRYARRAASLAAACAAVVVVAAALTWTRSPADGGPPVAEVVKAFGGNVVRVQGEVERSLAPGGAIRAGELIQSGLASGLSATYGSADVRLDAGTTLVFHRDRLELRQGSLYLDIPPLAGSAPQTLRVDTPLGSFSHLGTQFLVVVSADSVSGAVREGAIVLRHDGGVVSLSAARQAARRVDLSASGEVRETDVPAAGALWAWTLKTSSGIAVAGRAPDDVLRWVVRETGQRLVYADPAVERLARRRLRGFSLLEVDHDQAVALIETATRLRIDTTGDVLRVSMASEGDENP